MLDDLIRSLPRGLFAAIVIGLGIFLIIAFNPMHTPCVSQNKIFVEGLTPVYFTNPNPKFNNRKPPSLYSKHKDKCLKGTSLGACQSWFRTLDRLDKALVKAPSECVFDAASLPEVKSVLAEAPEIMVRLAWGAAPPKSSYYRAGWLDSYHRSRFCQFKEWYQDVNGMEAWKALQEKLMGALPGSENLSRQEVWERSLLSISCK